MKKPCCCVYIHTMPNNKVYIGWTRTNPEKRWNFGLAYEKANFQFFKDIVRVGWDNIRHDIVADNLTEAQATELEKQLIKERKANDPHFGYNLTEGGEGIASSDCRHGESENRVANRSNRLTYKSSKIILQYDLLGNYIKSYYTQTEAARELGVTTASIHDACTGKQFQTHGSIFVFEGEEDRIPILLKEAKERYGTMGFGKVSAEYNKAYGDKVNEILCNL